MADGADAAERAALLDSMRDETFFADGGAAESKTGDAPPAPEAEAPAPEAEAPEAEAPALEAEAQATEEGETAGFKDDTSDSDYDSDDAPDDDGDFDDAPDDNGLMAAAAAVARSEQRRAVTRRNLFEGRARKNEAVLADLAGVQGELGMRYEALERGVQMAEKRMGDPAGASILDREEEFKKLMAERQGEVEIGRAKANAAAKKAGGVALTEHGTQGLGTDMLTAAVAREFSVRMTSVKDVAEKVRARDTRVYVCADINATAEYLEANGVDGAVVRTLMQQRKNNSTPSYKALRGFALGGSMKKQPLVAIARCADRYPAGGEGKTPTVTQIKAALANAASIQGPTYTDDMLAAVEDLHAAMHSDDIQPMQDTHAKIQSNAFSGVSEWKDWNVEAARVAYAFGDALLQEEPHPLHAMQLPIVMVPTATEGAFLPLVPLPGTPVAHALRDVFNVTDAGVPALPDGRGAVTLFGPAAQTALGKHISKSEVSVLGRKLHGIIKAIVPKAAKSEHYAAPARWPVHWCELMHTFAMRSEAGLVHGRVGAATARMSAPDGVLRPEVARDVDAVRNFGKLRGDLREKGEVAEAYRHKPTQNTAKVTHPRKGMRAGMTATGQCGAGEIAVTASGVAPRAMKRRVVMDDQGTVIGTQCVPAAALDVAGIAAKELRREEDKHLEAEVIAAGGYATVTARPGLTAAEAGGRRVVAAAQKKHSLSSRIQAWSLKPGDYTARQVTAIAIGTGNVHRRTVGSRNNLFRQAAKQARTEGVSLSDAVRGAMNTHFEDAVDAADIKGAPRYGSTPFRGATSSDEPILPMGTNRFGRDRGGFSRPAAPGRPRKRPASDGAAAGSGGSGSNAGFQFPSGVEGDPFTKSDTRGSSSGGSRVRGQKPRRMRSASVGRRGRTQVPGSSFAGRGNVWGVTKNPMAPGRRRGSTGGGGAASGDQFAREDQFAEGDQMTKGDTRVLGTRSKSPPPTRDTFLATEADEGTQIPA